MREVWSVLTAPYYKAWQNTDRLYKMLSRATLLLLTLMALMLGEEPISILRFGHQREGQEVLHLFLHI